MKKHFKKFVESFKYFGTPDYKAKRYNLHFNWSLVIMFIVMTLLLLFFGLNEFQTYEGDVTFSDYLQTTISIVLSHVLQILSGGLFAWWGNWAREWYFAMKAKLRNPKEDIFDIVDVHFGTYGGLVGGILAILFVNLLF